jgi:hypothetical protein
MTKAPYSRRSGLSIVVGDDATVIVTGPTPRAVRRRIRAALRAVPAADREEHLRALVGMLHLIEEHCPEGREPRVFAAGPGLFARPSIHWASAVLGHALVPCPDCVGPPDHLTLHTRPLGGGEEEDGE